MNAGSSSEMRQRDDVLSRKPDASSFCLRRTRVNASSFRGIQISRGGRNLLELCVEVCQRVLGLVQNDVVWLSWNGVVWLSVWLRDLVREREMSVEEAREKSGCIAGRRCQRGSTCL
ncbi:hypothetical protein F511_14113 [Dorcoceras hygrometricum]|uniref:Uncharacterized protein n=1 Tax=Dorcoceras hygrometricum TaxID=472368 RepID=A0A2Z7B2C8_9LAMI|nr:hypothetical protein F511_14113 [Dorcoceras hygrometricum]